MKVSLEIFVILAATMAAAADKFLKDKPDFLVPCRLEDPNFKQCFAKNFQSIIHEWKEGIAGFKGSHGFDPIHVKRILIEHSPKSSVALNAELTDVIVTGGSDIVIQEASFDPKALVTELKILVPKLHFDAQYKVNGNILNLKLKSNGKTTFEVENCAVILNFHLKLRDEYGFTFADVDELHLDLLDVGGFHIKLENLFKDDKALEESAHDALNQNWRDLYVILKPTIEKAIHTIMNDRIPKAFAYVPANYFIADISSAAQHNG